MHTIADFFFYCYADGPKLAFLENIKPVVNFYLLQMVVPSFYQMKKAPLICFSYKIALSIGKSWMASLEGYWPLFLLLSIFSSYLSLSSYLQPMTANQVMLVESEWHALQEGLNQWITTDYWVH